MEHFEIHITGSPNIMSVLDKLSIKSLHAELLDPNFKVVGHVVRNVRSKKYVSTDRTYEKSEYDEFIAKWSAHESAEIEYCLFDDNVNHDSEWMATFNA